MARKFLTGDDKLEGMLRYLETKVADRVAKSSLSAGLMVLARGMKKLAPIGETRALADSIGRRLEKGKRGREFTAKAGINVGKMAKKLREVVKAPHSHLVALGTKKARTRKKLGGKFAYITNPTPRQLSTGVMPSNDFVRIAYMVSKNAVERAMRRRAERRLASEAARKR